MRHTFGTLAVQAFPLSDVKAYTGHADIQTTMIYVHHVPRHDAAAQLSAIVGAETTIEAAAVDSAAEAVR
jgi:integrase